MSYSNVKSEQPTSSAPIPRAHLLKFIIPSLIGVLLFLVPFQVGDTINIGMGLMADSLQALLGSALPAIAVVVLCLSVVATIYAKLANPSWAKKGMLHEMFHVGPVWLVMRVLGALFAVMTYFQFGPEFVTASFTGGVMLNDLAPVLLSGDQHTDGARSHP